jgi:large subunit ribosomal protein L3
VLRGLIGKKLGMTQYFTSAGEMIAVTVLEVGPCAVVQKKTIARDGYEAVKLGFRERKPEKMNRPDRGQYKHLDGKAYAVLKEFRTDAGSSHEIGAELTADFFQAGDVVEVRGTTKGRGFAGNIKRWGFGRGPMKHGSKFHRGVGGQIGTDPGKTLRGKKLPGHYGNAAMTVKGLRIVETRPGENIILVHGAVPGARNGMVTVTKVGAGKK